MNPNGAVMLAEIEAVVKLYQIMKLPDDTFGINHFWSTTNPSLGMSNFISQMDF